MPIDIVTLDDTFDLWRQKTNGLIDTVNSLGEAGDVMSVSAPSSGQVLVYNGTTFANVSLHGDITLASNGVVTVVGGANGAITKGRMRFAGSMKSVY